MTIAVQRASDRLHTDIDWLDSKHSFNFGSHYREADGGFGLLLVNNDDKVAAGGGFGSRTHEAASRSASGVSIRPERSRTTRSQRCASEVS